MTLVKTNDKFYSAIPSLIDSIFSRDWLDWNSSNFSHTNTTIPAVNIQESENEYKLEVAAPGMRKEDFKVSVENDQLTISSERKDETTDKKGNYSRREFSYQSFKRTFNLSESEVNSDKIEASYADGILRLVLPKREEAKPKPARVIKIG